MAGYRVALKPQEYGGRLVFYGGGKLGRDLSLPRLREGWPAPDASTAEATSAEWAAAAAGSPPIGAAAGGGLRVDVDQAVRQWADLNHRLQQVPIGDHQAWADAAHDVAGALTAWAGYDPVNRQQLRETAKIVARSAQLRRTPTAPGRRRVGPSAMGTARLFLIAAAHDKPHIAAALLIRQIGATMRALADYHQASRHAGQALALRNAVEHRLARVAIGGYAPGAGSSLARIHSAAARSSWRDDGPSRR